MRHKKEILAQALSRSGIGALMRTVRPWSGLMVLNYHRIGEASSTPFDSGVFSGTQSAFDEQLTWLKRSCDVIRLRDLDEVLKHPNGRFVLLTFDDGYLDNWSLAFPVLKRHGLEATFFVTTGFIDDRTIAWWDEIAWMIKQARTRRWPARMSSQPDCQGEWQPAETEQVIRKCLGVFKSLPTGETAGFLDEIGVATGSGRCPRELADWMTWDMLREMQQGGQAFGAHTVTHPLLARCSREQQQFEINESRNRLQTELGIPIEAFSYPVGTADAYTAETAELMKQAGMKWAFGFQGGYLDASATRGADHYGLPRIAMEAGLSTPRFQALGTLPSLFSRA